MKQAANKPFYLQLWMLIPHATLNPTNEQLEPYAQFAPGGKGFPHQSAAQIWFWRFAIWVIPVLVGVGAHRTCRALQRFEAVEATREAELQRDSSSEQTPEVR